MGFVISILYLITYYLTPATVFGPLGEYRIELIIAALALFVSIPAFPRSFLGKTPQSIALAGLALAIFASMVIGARWASGGVTAFLLFIPNAYAYFLVCLHFNTKKKLQSLVLMLLFVCLFVIAHGVAELREGLPTGAEAQSMNMDDSYFLGMQNDENEWIYRLRGMGQIHDPNDFAQLIVCVVPLMFIFWRKKKPIRNIAFVLLPVCVLLYGAFLTHSRGCVVAALAMVIVAARRRLGIVPSVLMACVLFAALSALNFTGGREISTEGGEDRTALWGDSMEVLKTEPLFGVGFGNLPDYIGHTAHNSVLVCAAEVGLFGLYFWSLFLLPTVRDALTIASPEKVGEGVPVAIKETRFPQPRKAIDPIDKAEVNKLGSLIVVSLTGFLVAGWFLSRAFVVTLFLLGAVTEVVFEMALQHGMVSPRLKLAPALRYSAVLAISLLLVMYVMLRVVNLSR